MNLKNLRQTALETAEKQARDSSDKNRNFYIAYLALSFYVLVMAAGVSDKELLLDQRELIIPLLSLGLKPSIWFIITPIALFVVYMDLILNLNEHLRKLLAWREANGGKLPPKQVQPFVVDFAFAHQGRGFWGTLYHFMLWLSVAMFAPLTLIVCLLKFGHYQSMAISALHLVLLLSSLGFAAQFMRRWRHKTLTPRREKLASRWQTFLNGLWRWLKRTSHTETICLLLTAASLGYADLLYGFASGQNPEWFKKNRPWVYEYWWTEDDLGNPYLHRTQTAWLLPVLQVTNTVLVSVDKDEKQALELLQQHQSGQQPAVRAIDAKPTTQTQANSTETGNAAMWWQYGAKLDLSERRLNYADLEGSLLPRTQLVNAWLKNVNLIEAQLQGAHLSEAQLQGAFLYDAHLQGAHLSEAQLQGAFLYDAHLQGADLGKAQLQKANLYNAQLQGAHLSEAQLQGAHLSEAQLQGADLSKAQLQKANLFNAHLQGADLGGAELQKANLFNAHLQGADLGGAELQGADLGGAELQGAYLMFAQLQGADLSGAQLQGAGCGYVTSKLSITNKTDLSQCQLQDWQLTQQSDLEALLAKLQQQLPEGELKRAALKRVAESLNQENWHSALCGPPTPEVLADIENYRNQPDGVPSEITAQWAQQATPCPAPGAAYTDKPVRQSPTAKRRKSRS